MCLSRISLCRIFGLARSDTKEVQNDLTIVTLKDTLYAPNMPFTLISIGRLDCAGYSLRVRGGCCEISVPKHAVIAKIPESK